MACAQKKAQREGRIIVFIDESGLSERPSIARTWSLRGQTPVLQHSFTWKQLSAIAGLSFWQFYFRFFPGAIRSEQIIEFLGAQIGKMTSKQVDYSGVARAVFNPNLEGRTAIIPRSMARELLRPRLYRWLEAAGHVTTIKAAKNLVNAEAPAANEALEAVAPTVPMLLMHETGPGAVGVEVRLGEGDAVVLSGEVFDALGLRDGDVVVVHMPVTEASEREVRSLGLAQLAIPSMPGTDWLGSVHDAEEPAPVLFEAALAGESDPLTDRLSRLMLGRLAT